MAPLNRIASALLLAFSFTALFYEKQTGLNFLLLQIALAASGLIVLQKSERSPLFYLSLSSSLILGMAYVYHPSSYVFLVAVCSMFIFAGATVYPAVKSVLNSLALGLKNIVPAPLELIISGLQVVGERPKLFNSVRKWYIVIAPLLIIVIFTSIYSASNSLFGQSLERAGIFASEFLDQFFSILDWELNLLFLLGLVIASIFFYGKTSDKFREKQEGLTPNLERVRGIRKPFFMRLNSLSLRDEYRSAVFLMIVLNGLLLLLNIMDIKMYWFGFEWEGEFLKPMLHQGTYLLILSILISMAVVLFYFRGNLNFYKKNTRLKTLSHIWLAQNALLALSVLVRTYHYIANFNLADKRIGVIFFVALCLISLYFIYRKISERRSTHFLVSRMSLAAFVVLVISATPDWDRIIAKYNFAHSETAFVHLDYLAGLSNSALDIIDIPIEELEELRLSQETYFEFSSLSSGFERSYYMDASEFRGIIDNRIHFLQRQYPERHWLEWNYEDYRAYAALKDRDVPLHDYR